MSRTVQHSASLPCGQEQAKTAIRLVTMVALRLCHWFNHKFWTVAEEEKSIDAFFIAMIKTITLLVARSPPAMPPKLTA